MKPLLLAACAALTLAGCSTPLSSDAVRAHIVTQVTKTGCVQTCTATVTNSSGSTVQNVVVHGTTCDRGAASATVGDLAAGATATVTLSFTDCASCGTWTLTVTHN